MEYEYLTIPKILDINLIMSKLMEKNHEMEINVLAHDEDRWGISGSIPSVERWKSDWSKKKWENETFFKFLSEIIPGHVEIVR